jgi:hypothetical protein
MSRTRALTIGIYSGVQSSAGNVPQSHAHSPGTASFPSLAGSIHKMGGSVFSFQKKSEYPTKITKT